MSVDPIAEDYPQLSSYNYAGNKPITARDIDGLQSSVDNRTESNDQTTNSNSSSQNSMPSAGQVVVAHGIATELLNEFGNNSTEPSIFTQAKAYLGLSGSQAKLERHQAVTAKINEIVSDNPDANIMKPLVNDMFNLLSHMSAFHPDDFAIAQEKISNSGTLNGKYEAIRGMIADQVQYQESFNLMGMILEAYASASPASSRSGTAMPKAYSGSSLAPTTGNVVQAVDKGKSYAFGLKDIVPKFADDIGANHLMKDPNWRSSFKDAISSPNNKIHFVLDGIDSKPMEMIMNPNRSGINWEMNTLYQNTEAFEKTTFYFGGSTFKGFEVFKINP